MLHIMYDMTYVVRRTMEGCRWKWKRKMPSSMIGILNSSDCSQNFTKGLLNSAGKRYTSHTTSCIPMAVSDCNICNASLHCALHSHYKVGRNLK